MINQDEPAFYFGYRGCWYGPFQDINEAWRKFRSKAEPYWAVNYYIPHQWYRDNVIYGVPTVGPRKELLDFCRAPKPLMRVGRVAHCRLCHQPVRDELVMYTEGYST